MIIGDYEYFRGTGIYVNGASVSVVDKTKSSYGQILSYVTIDGQRLPVITMADTFRNCTNLIVAPSIPETVQGMSQTFLNCTSLTTAPRIPPNVTTLYYCFGNCENLTGEVKVDTNQLRGSTQYTFRGTTKDIVLTGTSQSKELLAASANNGNVSVWSLETAITARRDETTPTTVNVSVTVDRFRGNNEKLSSLILSKNGEQITANWNDPTLTMTNNSVTFTCTLTGIEQTSAPTLSVVATDNYGSSTATSIKVPVSFYTMDVQAGGKEIAFGGLADDDLTNYPSGLFKCYMDIIAERGVSITGDLMLGAVNVGTTLNNKQDTLTTETWSPSITRSTGGTISNITGKQYGKLCMVSFVITYNTSVGAGNNLFTGTLSNNNPVVSAFGSGYYGSHDIITQISYAGTITVRNASASAVTVSDGVTCTVLYLTT